MNIFKNREEETFAQMFGLHNKNVLRSTLLIILAFILIIGAVGAGGFFFLTRDLADIDPANIQDSFDETSFILTEDGELIEQIESEEIRTIVDLDQVPKHLQDAFISIEDERFYSHFGIDPKGILASMLDNIKAGGIVRGASTITQQLVKNVYLTNERTYTRKIKEAYLAIKVERELTKDQILELYLNKIFLGQNSYGVQAAAEVYFNKDVEDLTLAESAVIAGIAKSSANFGPYKTIAVSDFNPETQEELKRINISGDEYVAIFNQQTLERQHVILEKMLKLKKINKAQFDEAMAEDIKANLDPGLHERADISSYFTDTVKTQVVQVLQDKLDYTEEEAREMLYTGGLRIYATIDLELQKQLEDIYQNFTRNVLGYSAGYGPLMINWRLDSSRNVIDPKGNIVYYSKGNLISENNNLFIPSGEFQITDEGLILNTDRVNPLNTGFDIKDFYIIDDNGNLTTFATGSINFSEDNIKINGNEIIISKNYLDETPDFYTIENDQLYISGDYFTIPKTGTLQPQSATVLLDYKKGAIRAIVGGRDGEGSRILNRATDSPRQTGSAMKTIATYLPALDNGYTAAKGIDDKEHKVGGKVWPRNWYGGYRGMMTTRKSLEISANVPPIKILEDIGIETPIPYLEKMGIIHPNNPERNNFVTKEMDPYYNDINPSALALGGMTKGLTPLEVTAAYGTIANNGLYIEPLTFSKIEDRNGNIILEDMNTKTQVLPEAKAYILKDMLRTTVTSGIASSAQVPGFATGGKTGTTSDQVDIWFAGFTPYYASAVWIGNDSPALTVTHSSGTAARFWRNIMIETHKDLERISQFEEPEGIVRATVCMHTGLIPGSSCSTVTEIFAEDTVPTKRCNGNHGGLITEDDDNELVAICTVSNKLAGEYCPDDSIILIDPNEEDIPSSYCDIHTKLSDRDNDRDNNSDILLPAEPSKPEEPRPEPDRDKPNKPEDDDGGIFEPAEE